MPETNNIFEGSITSLQHLVDTQRLAEFFIIVSLTLTLSLVLIYHPELNWKRETISEFDLPKIMLTYGMIGMISGFLFSRSANSSGS